MGELVNMNVSVAILLSAVLISGSILWTTEHVSDEIRCAGYLSSTKGGEALFSVAMLGIDSGKRERAEERADIEVMKAAGFSVKDKAKYLAAGLQAAGCRLDRVDW
jgi:hypothetical protein